VSLFLSWLILASSVTDGMSYYCVGTRTGLESVLRLLYERGDMIRGAGAIAPDEPMLRNI